MKTFAPDYYKNFRCSAGKCRHSCCIGWEIDIDPDTAEYYRNIPGEFGKRLCENIVFSEEGGVFRLCENERCPFLNDENLCDIYINLGEESLCGICSDHPRFRNFYESRTEIGIGLCCEEAAKLILEKKTPAKIVGIEGEEVDFSVPDEEKEFFALREKVFSIIQNREKGISDRTWELLGFFGLRFPENIEKWAEIYLGLERLDEKWTAILEKIKEEPSLPQISDETSAEQLLFYFVYRHFGNLCPEEAAFFSVLSFIITEKAAEYTGLCEAARLYSSEIEYSDENIEKILDAADLYEV